MQPPFGPPGQRSQRWMRCATIGLVLLLLLSSAAPPARAQSAKPLDPAAQPGQGQREAVREVLKSLGFEPNLPDGEGTEWTLTWNNQGKDPIGLDLSKAGMEFESHVVSKATDAATAERSLEGRLKQAGDLQVSSSDSTKVNSVSALQLGQSKGGLVARNPGQSDLGAGSHVAVVHGYAACGNLVVWALLRTAFAETTARPNPAVVSGVNELRVKTEARLKQLTSALEAKGACQDQSQVTTQTSAAAEVACPPPPNAPDIDYYLDLWGMWLEAYISAPSLFTHPYNLQKSELNPIRKKKSLLPSTGASTPEEDFKIRARAWTNGGALGRAVWDMALGWVRLHNRGEVVLSETQIRRIKALGHWAIWLQARSKVGSKADRDAWSQPNVITVESDYPGNPGAVPGGVPQQGRTVNIQPTGPFEPWALTRFESRWPKPTTPDGKEYPLVGEQANQFFQVHDPPPPDPSQAPGFSDRAGMIPEEVWAFEWSYAALLTLFEAELFAVDFAVPQAYLWTGYNVLRDAGRGYQSGGLGRGLVSGAWSLGTSKFFSWLTSTSWGPTLIGALVGWSELKLLFTGEPNQPYPWLQHLANLSSLSNLTLTSFMKTRSAPPEMVSDPDKGIFEGGENAQIAAQLDALSAAGAKPRLPGTNYRLIGDRARDPSTGLERQKVAFGIVGPFQGRTRPVGEPEIHTMDLLVKDGVDGPRYYLEVLRSVRGEQRSGLEPVFFLNQPGYHLKKHLDEINAGFSTTMDPNNPMISLLQVFKNTKYDLPLRILQQKLQDPSVPVAELNREYQVLVNQIIKDVAYPRILAEDRFRPQPPRPPGPLEGIHYLLVNSSCTGQQELVKIVVGKEGADAQRLINIFVVDQQGRVRNADTLNSLTALDQLVPASVARDPHFYKFPGLKDKLPVKP